MISPNMNLPVPTVGSTAGPQYSSDIDACLSLIDSHNHTSGNGVQIPTDGLNINADLSFGDNDAIDMRSVRFTPEVAALAGASDLACVYVVDQDLYYNDAGGNAVRITQNGAVAGTPGSIANLVSPASAAYVALSSKFVWQSDVNTAADMDFGSAILRNAGAASFGMTVSPPTLSADTSITLPARPASTKIMAMDSSGVITAPYTVDGSTIAIATNVIGVPNGAISTNQIATNVDLNGTSVKAQGRGIVVSNSSPATNLAIVRVQFDSAGTLELGEGATCVVNSSGVFTVTFTTAFFSAPVVVACSKNGTSTPILAQVGTTSASTVQICTFAGSTPTSARFEIIAMAPRT